MMSSLVNEYKRVTYFKVKHQLEFVEVFNGYLEGDRGVVEALSDTREAYVSIKGNSCIQVHVCDDLLKAVAAGDYSDTLRKYFIPEIAVGYEIINNAPSQKDSLLRISEIVVKEREIRWGNIKAMGLPVFIFSVGIALNMLAFEAMRMLEPKAKSWVVTNEMQIVEGIGSAVNAFGTYFIVIVFYLLYAIPKLQKTVTLKGRGRIVRSVFDNVWPLNLYRVFWGMRMMRLIGLMVRDMEEKEVYLLLKKYSPPFISEILDRMISFVEQGRPKSEWFLKGLVLEVQEIRLRPCYSRDSGGFSSSLLVISDKSEMDVAIGNAAALKATVVVVSVIGFFLCVLGVGALLDSFNNFQGVV